MVAEQCGDTQWTGAGVVADSGQPAFEDNTAGNKADLSEAHTSLAAVLASEAASKDSCTHVTADQEVFVKTLAEELKTSADAAQVFGSETAPLQDTRIYCSG